MVVVGLMTSVSDRSVMLHLGLSLRRVERGIVEGPPICSGPSLETCGLLFSVNWAVPRACVGGVPKQAMEKAAPVRGGGAPEHVGQSPGTASVRGAIFGARYQCFLGSSILSLEISRTRFRASLSYYLHVLFALCKDLLLHI